MAVHVVVGSQWGDEAKGKIVDLLAQDANYVVRYSGGNNAGHTVCTNGSTYRFHTVPCGVLRPHVTPVIAGGVALDLRSLAQELDILQSQGVSTDKLLIDTHVHLNLPYHRLMDELEEYRRGGSKLGTTKRGIGPVYADKAARIGLRMGDLMEPVRFRTRLQRVLEYKNIILQHVYGSAPLHLEPILEEFHTFAERFRSHVTYVPPLLLEAAKQNQTLLFEGAQGTLLDLDYGTYPYVTSSHPVAAGACLGTGIGPRQLDEIWGVAKAYTTRVGEGPFPTELSDERGDFIRERGKEYGTTTGRPRRCGWLDLVALRFSARINSFTGLAITLLDVLTGLDELQVCTAYRLQGHEMVEFNPDTFVLAECEPVYTTLPGWREDITHCRRMEELPENTRRYLQFIQAFIEVPIRCVSVGPNREQTLFL